MRRRFVTLDVFTNRRFAGNPLAIVYDVEDLDTVAMQAIAREFNLSETVFLLPPQQQDHRARLRIFTPVSELPFAGHPTVGTAVLLGMIAGPGEHSFLVEEPIGSVACTVNVVDEMNGSATFGLPKLPLEAGAAPEVGAIAAALGLADADVGMPGFAPMIYSAGVAMAFVPLASLDAVRRCRPDAARLDAALGAGGARAVYVFCRETIEAASSFHARMFAPALGVAEDPATGAAAAAFAGVLMRCEPCAGERTVVIEQGYEMGRPSRIVLTLAGEGGALVRAGIGGDVVVVSEGAIEA
jgi:trans-2,3-dihydro-3-hydroxyanthranilate isomerase